MLLRTPEHWRILFPTDADTADEVETSPARVQERLRGVADLGREWGLLHASLYRVHQRVADRFRVGRTLLVGDAAHVNNPLGGHGHEQRPPRRGPRRRARSATSWTGSGGPGRARRRRLDRRREVARSYVRAVTHDNWKQLRETDEDARAAHHASLRALAADPVASRDHLLRTSMIDSLREREPAAGPV